MLKSRTLYFTALLVTSVFHSLPAQANGMVPDTTLLLVNEGDKSSSINIKNTDTTADLLYTRVIDLPDDSGPHLLVTQPVTRVEAGQTQQVRFILTTDKPLTTEHLKRVTFEGIPPEIKDGHKIRLNVRQDLPVLIHPASLPVVKDAWTLLTWHLQGNSLTVKNPSPYVVRLAEQVELLPSKGHGNLGKTYLLPGQSISTHVTGAAGSTDHQVKFVPASRYGVHVENYTANLS